MRAAVPMSFDRKARIVLPALRRFPRHANSKPTKEHFITDLRNVAHDKKVQQEKKHQREEIAPGADKTRQPSQKTPMEHHASDIAKAPAEAAPVPTNEKNLA